MLAVDMQLEYGRRNFAGKVQRTAQYQSAGGSFGGELQPAQSLSRRAAEPAQHQGTGPRSDSLAQAPKRFGLVCRLY